MFIEARLIFQSYMPRRLEKGMLFQRKVSMRKLKTNIEYKEVFELKDIPRDTEAYILINGWPVEPYIYSITANPDDHAVILATPDLIGWWDDEPDAVYEEDAEDQGTLRDIEVKDFNYALENYEGNIDIQVYDDEFKKGIVRPVIYAEKVTLNVPMIKDNTDEDDWDVTSGDGLEEEEPWDDMDDISHNESDDYDRPE
jgi:hypothetical protein